MASFPVGVGRFGAVEDPITAGIAAKNLNDYFVAKGCDHSSQLVGLIQAFQREVNLTADGDYGPATRAALDRYIGTPFAANCYNNTGGVRPPTPTTPVTPSPTLPTTPTAPAPIVPVVNNQTVKEEQSPWLWILGGAALLLGVGWMVYSQNKKRRGGLKENPIKRRRRRRTSSRARSRR